jgi:hypothetical protein
VGKYDETTGKYKIPVISRSKNLINYKNFVSRNQATLPLTINNDGSLDYNGDYYIKINASHLVSGKTYLFDAKYTFDGELVTERMGIFRFVYDDETLSTGAYFGVPITSDATKKIKEIYCYFKSGYTQKYTVKVWDIMLVEGSTPMDYEPYVEPITTNIYLDEPLTINDYIDFRKQQLFKDGVPIDIELPNIPTIKGTTILEIETEIQPSIMGVKYDGKGKNQSLDEDNNIILNSIISSDTETEIDMIVTEINETLDEIIGG